MLFSKLCKLAQPSVKQFPRLLQKQIILRSIGISIQKKYLMSQAIETQKNIAAFTLKPQEPSILQFSEKKQWLTFNFSNGATGTAPYLWMRDNCQCDACYDASAKGRKFLMQNLDMKLHPQRVWQENDTLFVIWNDAHRSMYPVSWLHERSFTASSKESYVRQHSFKKLLWGKDLNLATFNYSSLVNNESYLLDYLTTLEEKGAVLVKKAPLEEDAGAKLIDHIAFVKPSHFGRRSPVRVRKDANNLAFTSSKLGLHTDLPQYDYQAGIIFIHVIKQHEGNGGESVISDGFHCAEILREKYPAYFKTLISNDVFFWDKGQKSYHLEMDNFYKINKGPVIRLGADGNIDKISVNDQVRDSHMNMPYEKVPHFYEALKTYNNILYEHSYRFKMENGDIITLDNLRCLHGRESFADSSDRHIESSYLDWDEARCRRRRLQEKILQ